jgi:hypothetical protein
MQIFPAPSYFPLVILSSALCPQTPTICVLPLMRETEFHTHTKQKVFYMLSKINSGIRVHF